MILLVRHAHAGDRDTWDGDDRDRPLSSLGVRQAELLPTLLSSYDVGGVWSSPAARCTQTVEPLAAAGGSSVATTETLWETTPLPLVRDWLAEVSRSGRDVVLCSHGDLIGPLVEEMELDGAVAPGARRWDKGSAWALRAEGRRVIGIRYHPPPA